MSLGFEIRLKVRRLPMRLPLLFLLVASLVLVPAALADSAPPAIAADSSQILPVEDGGCDTNLAPEADLTFGALDFEKVGTQFDAKQGAEDRGTCWTETKRTYSCSCPGWGGVQRARVHNFARECCEHSGCESYQPTSSYCTGNVC